MALNFSKIGVPLEPADFSYTEDDAILYALGIGAQADTELDFLYEKNLKIFPTFSVVPGSANVSNWHQIVGIDLGHLLQLAHEIQLYAPIPPSGTVTTTVVYHPVYDRGDSGALIQMTGETRNAEGKLLFINRCTLLDRSAGNFGGDPGPLERELAPPTGRPPDFTASYTTSTNQAALYRLSGDKNPMHIDPDFAVAGGFKRPILHGLCTYGMAGRAAFHHLCHGDPDRFRLFSARFCGIVYPGETLSVQGWRIGPNLYSVQAKAEDGRLVLDGGLVNVAEPKAG